MKRLIFRDPKPLSPDEPEFADARAALFYLEEQYKAVAKMRDFDRAPAAVRHVDQAVGNLTVARQLVSQGIKTTKEAEPIVREMLGARQAGRR